MGLARWCDISQHDITTRVEKYDGRVADSFAGSCSKWVSVARGGPERMASTQQSLICHIAIPASPDQSASARLWADQLGKFKTSPSAENHAKSTAPTAWLKDHLRGICRGFIIASQVSGAKHRPPPGPL